MDDVSYFKKLEYQTDSYESLCKRCGVCCGSTTDDPCANLIAETDGTHICRDYEHRHGPQTSVRGQMFACVNIRDVIAAGAHYPNCPYCKNET